MPPHYVHYKPPIIKYWPQERPRQSLILQKDVRNLVNVNNFFISLHRQVWKIIVKRHAADSLFYEKVAASLPYIRITEEVLLWGWWGRSVTAFSAFHRFHTDACEWITPVCCYYVYYSTLVLTPKTASIFATYYQIWGASGLFAASQTLWPHKKGSVIYLEASFAFLEAKHTGSLI